MAPELHSAEHEVVITRSSDVYAFGMTMLEVRHRATRWVNCNSHARYQIFSGRHPFPELVREGSVMMAVVEGRRPERPDTALLTDDVWKLMTECWSGNATARPSIQEIVTLVSMFGPCYISDSTYTHTF